MLISSTGARFSNELQRLCCMKWYQPYSPGNGCRVRCLVSICPNIFMSSFVFSCDQAALRTAISVRLSVCLSVRPSVRPSVCDTFLTMFMSSYHHGIFRSSYQWQKWCPCKRSRSEVKGQGHRGHDPIWPFPDRNSSLNSYMVMKWCTKLDVA